MSNKRGTRKFRITFEDDPEIEVYARGVSIRNLFSVLELADEVGSLDEMTADHAKRLVATVLPELYGWFIKRVTAWNLQDEDGNPLPVGVDALLDDDDFSFGLRLVMQWVQAITSVSVPLPATSGMSTAASPPEVELDLPMSPPMPE